MLTKRTGRLPVHQFISRSAHKSLWSRTSVTAWVLMAVFSHLQDASADILKGRIASLTHPVVMFLLLATTLWTGYLGWQWRRVRTIQDDISELKKQLPAKGEDGKIPPSPVDAQIAALTEVRVWHRVSLARDLRMSNISNRQGSFTLFKDRSVQNLRGRPV